MGCGCVLHCPRPEASFQSSLTRPRLPAGVQNRQITQANEIDRLLHTQLQVLDIVDSRETEPSLTKQLRDDVASRRDGCIFVDSAGGAVAR